LTEKIPGDRSKLSLWVRTSLSWLDRSISLKFLLSGVVLVAAAGAIFISFGGVDVSADKPDGWLMRNLLHFVFKRSEASRSISVAPPADLAALSRVQLAAQHFDMVCSNCHGRPGYGQSVTALSMSPRPQYLPHVIGQFTDPELYMIVEHGVKFSAMPSWPTGARGDEVWSMVAFLRQLPKLDAKSYLAMTRLPQNSGPPANGSGDDAALRPADARRNAPPRDEFLYAAPASGFSDQTIHTAPVATCSRCHGADGTGGATGGEAPNLTIQDAGYLRKALDAYTSGSRKSGFMQTIAAELSAAQVETLANYYAALPVRTVVSPPADPALVKRGELIATLGIPELAVPACSSCHESSGSTITGAPHIAGQSATYLRRELGAMRRGGRGSSVWWNPMPAVAHDLGDKDITALAAYYSGLKPGKAPGGSGGPPTRPPMLLVANQTDIATAEKTFETRCVKCHINNGRGDPQGNFPNLTIQTTPFVAQSLYAFHVGVRPSSKMSQATQGLSFGELGSIAAYVNSLKPQPALETQAAPAVEPSGAAIATAGDAARGIPACLSCHGAKGVAALPLIPRLQGQNRYYLRRRLDYFAKPYAENLSALNPMPSIARKLTDRERADLAVYFAAAPLLGKSRTQP